MSWDIAAAGTMDLDDITTPHGHRTDLLGGSVVYFALSARNFAHVHMHGVVGEDAAKEFLTQLEHANVSTDGIKVNNSPTRTWKARHDFERWVAVVDDDAGGFAAEWDDDWDRHLTTAAVNAPVLFVGSMSPYYQLDIIEQSHARLVGSDSMKNFIVSDHDAVMDVVSRSDVLFSNHEELAALCRSDLDDWRDAAGGLLERTPRLRAVVVKAGPLGAALVTRAGVTKRAAAPVDTVIDPTGAGDSLAAGFLGYCAQHERDDEAIFLDALDCGLQCAARAIGSFGTAGVVPAVVRS